MSTDRQRRRQFVNRLIAVNACGFVGVGTWLGGVFKDGSHVPWFGLGGVLMLFLGIALPFYREFIALRAGFEEIQQDAVRSQQRQDGRLRGPDVFPPQSKPQGFQPVRHQQGLAVAITAAAWALVLAEVAQQYLL